MAKAITEINEYNKRFIRKFKQRKQKIKDKKSPIYVQTLESPPGQDVIRSEGGRLYLHLPGYITDDIMSLVGQFRIVAACVGSEMWRKELDRLTGHGARISIEKAYEQMQNWRRWGNLII